MSFSSGGSSRNSSQVFFRHELHGRNGWLVSSQRLFRWKTEAPTPGLLALLPSMLTDLVIDHESTRTVIDTKFTGLVTKRPSGNDGFKSAHIYQLYSYLRSQAGSGDPRADNARGILLHPSVNSHIDESVAIQGHRIRFVTIDLGQRPSEIRRSLLSLVMDKHVQDTVLD